MCCQLLRLMSVALKYDLLTAVYGGTKAFVHHFTMGSRFHYAKSNIRIVEIAHLLSKPTWEEVMILVRSVTSFVSMSSSALLLVKLK